MNSFGRLFRISMLGESHGPCVGILIDGCPAGIPLSEEDFLPDLDRRKSGRPGTTARKEDDRPCVMSGLFHGRTTGAPMLVLFENRDVDSAVYEQVGKMDGPARRTSPPGEVRRLSTITGAGAPSPGG